MRQVEKAAERLAFGLSIAISVTLVCGAMAAFPEASWWSPVIGVWIAVLFHIAVLGRAIWREARR